MVYDYGMRKVVEFKKLQIGKILRIVIMVMINY